MAFKTGQTSCVSESMSTFEGSAAYTTVDSKSWKGKEVAERTGLRVRSREESEKHQAKVVIVAKNEVGENRECIIFLHYLVLFWDGALQIVTGQVDESE